MVHKVVSQPPTEEFIAGIHLQMGALPVSELPSPEPKEPPPAEDSSLHQQTASYTSSSYISSVTSASQSPPKTPEQATPIDIPSVQQSQSALHVVSPPGYLDKPQTSLFSISPELKRRQEGRWATSVFQGPSPTPIKRGGSWISECGKGLLFLH